MKYFFIALFLLNAISVRACVCSVGSYDDLGYRNHNDLQPYNFIALVEIKKLPPRSSGFGRISDDIGIEVIEQFRGKPITTVFDGAYNSDCALEPKEGEQWLFFGALDKNTNKVFVGSCGFSRRYRGEDGTREWAYFNGLKDMDVLRKLFLHTDLNFNSKIYYPNGKLEIEQNFNDHKLDGIRKIFYPSGKLYIEEKFKNGYRSDYRKVFAASGQLIKHVLYKDGLINKITTYHDTSYVFEHFAFLAKYQKNTVLEPEPNPEVIKLKFDSLRKTLAPSFIAMVQEYKSDGRSYTAMSYHRNGKLNHKSYVDVDKQIRESTSYKEDGVLSIYIKDDVVKDQSIEYDYKPDGSRREFIKKCQFCYIYFDRNAQPPALPEKIYIQ